ncbi:MAG TPA: hypothetical protein VED17_10715 [Nitrososphaerales archaeon]|nr:hypothetical protein [Nitrososphaerales archaeon]
MQSIARRRLGLTGEVEFVQKEGPGGRILAVSNPKASLEMKHVFVYSRADSLDPADIYHEMSRAKLYELGFKTVENAALLALKDCAGEDPKYIFDANSAVVIVAEVYSSYLLYSNFPEESEKRRQDTVLRFESSDALTNLHTQMGFWGTAGIAYYKLAAEWAGKDFPTKQVDAAISRASDGKIISEELQKIETALSQLPKIETPIRNFSDSEQLQILSVISELFTAKTGIECN